MLSQRFGSVLNKFQIEIVPLSVNNTKASSGIARHFRAGAEIFRLFCVSSPCFACHPGLVLTGRSKGSSGYFLRPYKCR